MFSDELAKISALIEICFEKNCIFVLWFLFLRFVIYSNMLRTETISCLSFIRKLEPPKWLNMSQFF